MTVIRRLLRSLVVLVLVVLAFAVGALAVLTLTDKGRENLAGMISRLASTDDSKVTLSGIRGIWSGALRVDRLVLEDAQGPWLAAREVEIDWSPLALLGSAFEADRVSAARVEVARLPAAGKDEVPDGKPFALPVDIAVKSIDLPDIALGQALAGGQVASVSATGKATAQADPLVVDAEVTATRSDGVAGSVVAVIGFAPSANRLELDLKASEPAGGILASLLRLPGEPSVDIIVSGTGPAANWKGAGTFAVDGGLVASVAATHRLTNAGSDIEAKGDGDFASFVPDRFKRVLEGKTTFDVALTATNAGGFEIRRADILGTAVTATAAGQYDPEGATDFSFEVTAREGGLPLSFGTEEAPIDITVASATLRALGDGREPGLDIAADLPLVATNAVRLNGLGITLHSDGFDLSRRIGPFTGGATAQSLVIDNPTLEPLVAGEIRAGLEGTLEPDTLTVTKGSLRSDAIDGSFGGTVSLADGSITLDLKAGVLSSALPAGARPLLGETVALSTSLERDSKGNTSANALSVVSGGLSVKGSALLSDGRIDAKLDGTLADIAPAVPGGSGSVALSATATGAFLSPDVSATLTSPSIGFRDNTVENLDLTVRGRVASATPDVDATLKGSFRGQALDAKATLAASGGSRQLRDLAFALGPNRITGTLALGDDFLPEGTLQFDLPDLGSLAALAGQSVQGAAQGTATFATPGGVPQVALSLSSSSIARDQFAATAVDVEALVKSYLLDPSITGTIGATIADLIPDQPPVTVDVTLDGDPADISADGTLSIAGAPLTTFTASHQLTDAGSVVAARGRATLDRLLPPDLRPLFAGGAAFDLAATIGQAGVVAIDRLTAETAAFALGGAGRVDPAGTVDVSLDLSPSATAAPLRFGSDGQAVEVTIGKATLRASGPAARPVLDLSATLPAVVAPGARLADAVLTVHSDGFDTQTRSGPLTGTAVVASIALDDPTAAPLLAGEVRAAFDAELSPETLTIRSGSLSSEALDGSFDGTVSLGDGAVTFNLRTDVATSALPAAARPALGETLQAAAAVARDAQGAISVTGATVGSGPLSARGSARLSGETLEAEVEGALADISPLAPQAAGAIAFSARAGGTLADPDLDARVTSERIALGDRVLEGLDLSAKGKLAGDTPDFVALLKARFEGQALEGQATLGTSDGQRALRDLSLALGPNRITGTLALDEASLPEGALRLDLADLAPLAALAGQQASGSAQGTATFSRSEGVPQVDVDLASPSLTAAGISAASVKVDALVRSYLSDPAVSGTVGATLSDLIPGQPPVTVEAKLDGTPAAITGEGTLSMENAPLATFSASHRLGGGGSIVTARGSGTVERLLPEQARALVAGGLTYDVAATIGDGGRIAIDRAVASSAAIAVTATGTVDPTAGLGLTIDLAPGSANAPLTFGPEDGPVNVAISQARLRVTGPVAKPTLDLSARLDSVSAPGARLSDVSLNAYSEAFDTQAMAGPLSGTAVAGSVVLENATLAPLLAGEMRAAFSASLTPETLVVQSGSLRSAAIDGAFDGTVSLGDGAVAFKLRSDVAAAALPAAARPVLGETVSISGSVARDAAGALAVETVSVTSGPLTASGSARIAGNAIDARIGGKLGDIAPLAPQASGAIEFEATARGELSAPDLDVKVSSARMTVAERAIENLLLSATARADLENPSATVSLKGTVGGEALDGRAVLETSNGNRAVRDLSLSLGANRIEGSLSLDADFVPEGSVDLTLPDIGPLAALALETVEGSLNGTIVFERRDGAPRMAVKASSKSIVRGDLSIADVAVDATVTNYLAAPGVAGKVRAKQLRSGTTTVSGVDIDLSRDGTWTKFAGGATVSGIPLKAAGRVEVANGVTTVELASAQAVVQGIATKLARATTVRIVNGATRLDRLALSLGSGTATISGTAGTTLDLNVALAGLPASLANQFAAGLDASGPISGTVRVTGAAASPSVNYTLDWTGAQTAQTRAAGIGALTLRSTGTYAGNRLSFDASAANGGGLSFKAGGNVGLSGVPQLDIRVTGAVPLGALGSQLAAQGIAISGTANVDLTVRGAATAPAISGSIRAAGARLVYVDAGIALNDIAADIAIASNRATINRATGTISSGGTVSASGSVGIAPGSGFPADISIRVADGRYTDGRVVTTTVAAELALKGPLVSAPVLTGTIDLARTVISIPERLPGSLAALDVKHKDAPAAVRRQDELLRPAAAASGGSGGLTLDVTVNAPQRIFVQGRGLDAELGGSLRLVGPVSSPQATGGFELRRGRLLLLGRRLTFTEGSITFSGSLVPDLNFQATSEAADATVTVIVSGPANNPKFTFTSSPSLPEDEVLAQLIFGRAMSNLSAVQLAQLADAAAQLAGAGGSTSLLTSLRDKLGVDNIDVTTGESGGANVTVGKYLNDRTYLSIESGDKAGSGKASIDLDVGRGVKLRGEARDDGQAKGGIFFEREY